MKEYYVSVDRMVAVKAKSEEEALKLAKQEFIDALVNDEGELIVVETHTPPA